MEGTEIQSQSAQAIPSSLSDAEQTRDPTPTQTTASSTSGSAATHKEISYNYPKDQPVETIMGGAPIRQWINKHLTKAVLDGMRHVAKQKPQDPVRVLGEYLIKISEENKQRAQQTQNQSTSRSQSQSQTEPEPEQEPEKIQVDQPGEIQVDQQLDQEHQQQTSTEQKDVPN